METYALYSDQILVELVKEGDRLAFTEVFNRYNKLLYSHVYNKLRDEESARDLVQDIFVALWEKRASVQSISLSGYLFTMSRNKLLNLLSHHKIVSDYANTIQRYVQPAPEMTDDLVRERQLSAIIDAEINALPAKMREIFILSRYEHMTNKQIAEKLNLSEHTVATQIKNSLKTLRNKIGLSLFVGVFCQQLADQGTVANKIQQQIKNNSIISSDHLPDSLS